jgi:hypothetical protein
MCTLSWLVVSSQSNQLRTSLWSGNPGKHVPSRDWYRTTFLLIRITEGMLSSEVERGMVLHDFLGTTW